MPELGHCTAARCGNTAFPIASGCLRENVRLRDVPKRELRRRAAFKETERIGSDIIRLDVLKELPLSCSTNLFTAAPTSSPGTFPAP